MSWIKNITLCVLCIAILVVIRSIFLTGIDKPVNNIDIWGQNAKNKPVDVITVNTSAISTASYRTKAEYILINVNQVDAETLADALVGVGLKKAANIVEYRRLHGDFKSHQELENVKGIGPKIIAKNKHIISFY